MFDCRAENNAVRCHAKTGIHDQTKQQFSAALADKKLTIRRIHQDAHIILGLFDDAHQFMRSDIVPSLVVRDRSISARIFDNGMERQSSAGIFKENPLALFRTMIDLGELTADGLQHFWRNLLHGEGPQNEIGKVRVARQHKFYSLILV